MRRQTGLSLAVLILIFPTLTWALCVKVSSANLRAGPGVQYEKTWEASRDMPLQRLGRKGNWYKVRDVDGDVHWIHKKMVTNAHMCAAVKAREANLREGPGTTFAKASLFPAIKYTTFRYVRRKGTWTKVKDRIAGVLWIFSSLVWVQ